MTIINCIKYCNFVTQKHLAMNKSIDWLIVGLGNHTEEYLNTRHNIGWMVVTAFAKKHNGQFAPVSKYFSLAKVNFKGRTITLLLPRTFMNFSGYAVRIASESFGIKSDRIVVVCDEYNFPLGRIHLKEDGGDGGHNGVASVIDHLGTRNFLRLRCGIGRNFGEGELVDYVLSPFLEEEVPVRDLMISKAVEALEYLIIKGKARAMSDINSEKLWKISFEKDIGVENGKETD